MNLLYFLLHVIFNVNEQSRDAIGAMADSESFSPHVVFR